MAEEKDVHEMENLREFAIGIDIGGTNTKFGLVNHRGDISNEGRIKTADYGDIPSYIKALGDVLKKEIEAVGGLKLIKGIGVGVPNGNYYNGKIEYAPNLPWKGVIPLADLIAEEFNCPCTITNDANAAAIGEMNYGAAIGMKDFIMITLGTGVGSGIVANGHLIYGHDGFAGELGHTTIIPGGRLHPHTGMRGSLESYASATGIRQTVLDFLDKNPETMTPLREIPRDEVGSKDVYEAALEGDKMALDIFEYTGEILGLALANFVMFSSPAAIILFGGVTKAGKLLMDPIRKHMEKNLLPIFQNKVDLIFSELKESDAAILGASALVWEQRKLEEEKDEVVSSE